MSPSDAPTAASGRGRELPPVHLRSDELSPGPWVFGRQVDLRGGGPPPQDGALVELRDASDRFVGHGLYNGASDIRVRLLSRGRRSDLQRPREFLLRAIASADRLRRKVLRLAEQGDAFRVVHAEGDDLPGLIVDRLGPCLVCEHHALGFWRLRAEVTWALEQLHPGVPVHHRMPRNAAKAEGLGEPPPDEGNAPAEVWIRENGLEFPVVPAGGHKTGWFCDQRENRARIAALAPGRDVLDLFCNAGGFALGAARAGARSVRAVDLDERVLERARAASERNRLPVELLHADAFDVLRAVVAGSEAGRPGLIVVDPHKLIRSRAGIEEGLRKYSDLNALAFQALRPGGLVASFSCSGSLAESAFVGMLFQSARRAGRGVRLLAQMGAGPDHPQRPDFSRSRYLKGALLAAD